MVVGLVGATGLVGRAILQGLEERRIPISGLRLWASSRLPGRRISFKGREHPVRPVAEADFAGCGIVFFAGTEGEKGASRLYASRAIEAGAVVIDNGSDFRLEAGVPLVVPEVNPGDIWRHRGLIANPNCSTIQLVTALNLVHREAGIRRIVVSTYQAVSGAGRAGITALDEEIKGLRSKYKGSPFAKRIAANVIPQISEFGELGYSGEEWKMANEARKIFHDRRLAVNATAVRVPVETGHAESVYFETRVRIEPKALEKLLARTPGVVFAKQGYQTPLEAAGRDQVFVSRLRPDPVNPLAFSAWVVADNLRKGAATNAVQIAQLLIKSK
jgi:aspartate-semialdehyde dehydrogenase